MAEGLIQARLAAEDRLGQVSVSSVGTWARPDCPATDKAVITLAERDIDISSHRSREVSAEILAEADLILVMTRGHQEAILAEFPEVDGRIHRFSHLDRGAWDVVDPVSQPLASYQATARELERLIEAGWSLILGEAAGAASDGS